MATNVTMPLIDLVASLAPSPAPSVVSDWTCQDFNDPIYAHLCYPPKMPGYGLDSRLIDRLGSYYENSNLTTFFLCKNNVSADGPTLKDCQGTCYVQETTEEKGSVLCSACALVSEEEIAYDCRNLLQGDEPDLSDPLLPETCAARNSEGYCGDYVHWSCFNNNLGYACTNPNREYNLFGDTIFPFDDNALDLDITLYCANDISGLPKGSCYQPKCNVFSLEPRVACDSCTVTNANATHDFAYNCANVRPLECPILLEDGSCPTYFLQDNVTNFGVEGIAFPARHNRGRGWGWTITSMSSTGFNVLSDIVGYITRILIGMGIAAFYPLFMTWQIRFSGKPVPVKAIGSVPGDFVTASGSLVRWYNWSLPAIVLAIILFIADFSHSLADIGMEFVELYEPDSLQPILNVPTSSADHRNTARTLELSGDPQFTRTSVYRVSYLEGRVNEAREESALVDSFVQAATLICRGLSPLTLAAPRALRKNEDFGGVSFNTYHLPDDSPLTALPTEIPVECYGPPVELKESIYGFPVFDTPLNNTALLPNCTLSGTRSTGIYNDGNDGVDYVTVLEEASFYGIAPDIDAPDNGKEILLRNGSSTTFQKFTLTKDEKLLTIDREDWKKGREVSRVFNGLQVGSLAIDFGRIVLATGPPSGASTEYGFAAQITSDCPHRPSGLPSFDTECLALMVMKCEEFEEDSRLSYHELYDPYTVDSECELNTVSIMWGRNWGGDADLASEVAAMYGVVEPSGREISAFNRNSILAALFVRSTVQERLSEKVVVRARVGVLYMFFMLLPFFLLGALIYLVKRLRDRIIVVPSNPWELMILGQEDNENIPKRPTRNSAFPESPEDYVLTFYDADEPAFSGSGLTHLSELTPTTGGLMVRKVSTEDGNVAIPTEAKPNETRRKEVETGPSGRNDNPDLVFEASSEEFSGDISISDRNEKQERDYPDLTCEELGGDVTERRRVYI